MHPLDTKLSQSRPKVVPKLSQNCPKVVLELSQNCPKSVSKLSYSGDQVVLEYCPLSCQVVETADELSMQFPSDAKWFPSCPKCVHAVPDMCPSVVHALSNCCKVVSNLSQVVSKCYPCSYPRWSWVNRRPRDTYID